MSLVKQALSTSKASDREALLSWLSELREIRDRPVSNLMKTQAALRASVRATVVIALAKALAPEVHRAAAASKQVLWDERGWAARLGLAGVTLGAFAFGSEAAGVAALGSAVGVPLWLVVGAGGSFLGAMIEELERGKRVG
jgi:hypothetical protein